MRKRISFPEAIQLVETKSPSTVFSSGVSFADVVSKKKKKRWYGLSDGSHLGFFGHSRADCPFCCTCFWRSGIGIDLCPGFLREVRAGFDRRPGTVRVRVASGQEFWVFRCWNQFFSQAPDFDPRGRVMAQFRALSPTDGAWSWTSASRRKAVAGKVKVAGAWVHAAEFWKRLAFRPTAKPTGTSKKKGGGDKQAKDQYDPVKNL